VRRRGFTLNEVLAALAILVVVMDVGGRLFQVVVTSWRDDAVFANESARTDQVLSKLRQDVWTCDEIVVTNAQSVRLHNADGSWMTWTFGGDGVAERAGGSVADWRCPSVSAGWSMHREGNSLVVQDSGKPNPGRVVLPSEVLLARGGSW
jgi:prepilin-type N-terminal cleavage/methylation domain-containing protein